LVETLQAAMRNVAADTAFHDAADAGGYYVAWTDGAAWLQQTQAEEAVLAKLWQTDPWLASSGG
jgi:hypothetical protein